MQAVLRGLVMEQWKLWLCWGSLSVAGVLLVLFLPDLIFNFPFGKGIGPAVDVTVLLAAVLLGYLSYNALRDLR
jgi:hypothetical protein